MNLVSYAQNFEDVMLWRALGHIQNGRYIDIGAQHPVVDSVSLAFYEHGWHGIHVEPTPHYAELLRKARPEDIVIQAAVGDKSDILNFYEFPDTGLSTTDRKIAEQHINNGLRVQEIVVTGVTLDEVFLRESNEEIHWLKIDVEGGEKQVLDGWVSSPLRPWVVLIESTYPNTQIETHQKWEPLILAKGYRFVYFDGLSRFYIAEGHDELFKAFSSGPNVFDVISNGFSLSATTPFCGPLNSQIHSLEERSKHELQEAEQRISLREHELDLQLKTAQQQLRLAAQDHTQREQVLSEQTSRALQERENLFHTLARSEKETAAQLLAVQQQAAQEKDKLSRSHSEREEALQRQHVERERDLGLQLQDVQLQLHQIGQERSQQEQELSEQNRQARQKLEDTLHSMTQREKETAAQLLAVQQQAAQEKDKLSRSHSEREQTLNQHIQSAQQQLHLVEQARSQQEQYLSEQNRQVRQKLEDALHSMTQHEQDNAVQLLAVQQQGAQERTELARSYSERERAFSQQMQNAQQQLTHAFVALEAQLRAELQTQQQNNTQLNIMLAEVQQRLKNTEASFSWRITQPLRKLASIFSTAES